MTNDIKLDSLKIRLTVDEKNTIKALAKKNHCTMSDYIRRLILQDIRSNTEVIGKNNYTNKER